MNSEQRNIGYVIDKADNVATLPWGGAAGSTVHLRGGLPTGLEGPVLHEDIAPGHKVALTTIARQAPVLKYGQPIGSALHDIAPGALVHVENVRSRLAPDAPGDAGAEPVGEVIQADELVQAVVTILQAAGAAPEVARDAGRHCTSAELRGVTTHGIRRLPALVTRLRAGGVDGSVSPNVQADNSLIHVDGRNGLGHHVARVAADEAVDVARSAGVAIAVIRNSSHFGYAGFYATRIAEAGMVGMAISNGQVLVGPHGAQRAIFSNNPIALSAPVGEDGIFEFDMATSVTSRARIAMAAERDETIAAGIALDRDGHPTTSAADALQGILLPLGGDKGFGFIAALEVLTGILPGGAYADQVVSKQSSPGLAEGTSHFLMAISPEACGGEDALRARMSDLEQRLASLPMAPGHAPARFPGARRNDLMRQRLVAGIPLAGVTADMLQALLVEAAARPETAK